MVCHNEDMQFIRKTTLGAVASLLVSTLLLFGLGFGLVRVFGTTAALKGALKQSGLYRTAVPDVLDQAQKESAKQGGTDKEQLPLNDPGVQSVIRSAASPDFLQSQTEGVLDDVYAWLQGKSPRLSFTVDMAEVKIRLGSGVEQYAKQRLASLPTCAGGASSDTDPFSATCVPAGTDINQIAAEAKNHVLEGDFLKDPELSADKIQTGKNSQTLDQQLKNAPTVYRDVTRAVWGLGALSVLLAVGVFFLSRTRRAGIKKLAIVGIVDGALIALLGWGVAAGLDQAAHKLSFESQIQKTALKVGQILAGDLRFWYMVSGLALVALGIGALVALHFTKPKLPVIREGSPEELSATTTTTASAPTTPAPRPRPTRKLVQ